MDQWIRESTKKRKFCPPKRKIISDPLLPFTCRNHRLYDREKITKFGETTDHEQIVKTENRNKETASNDKGTKHIQESVTLFSKQRINTHTRTSLNPVHGADPQQSNKRKSPKTLENKRKKLNTIPNVSWTIRRHLEKRNGVEDVTSNISKQGLAYSICEPDLDRRKLKLEVLADIYRMQNQLQIIRGRRADLAKKMIEATNRKTTQEE